MISLTTWTRCLVDSVERDPKTYDLILSGTEDQKSVAETARKFRCRLREAWSNCRVQPGDVVSLKAPWNSDKSCHLVTNASGFIVTHPDLLISGTTVVNGLFCLRKAVLSDRFSGIEANSKIVSNTTQPQTPIIIHLCITECFLLA